MRAVILQRALLGARDDDGWFGGLPTLGGLPWPRGRTGEPLHFIAQLNLAAMPDRVDSPLPRDGWLAFFASTRSEPDGLSRHTCCTVLRLDRRHAETAPPDDLPLLYEPESACHFPWASDLMPAPRSFTRWPMEIRDAGLPADASNGEIETRLGLKRRDNSLQDVLTTLPRRNQPWLWASAQIWASGLIAHVERLPRTRARFERAVETLREEAAASPRPDAPLTRFHTYLSQERRMERQIWSRLQKLATLRGEQLLDWDREAAALTRIAEETAAWAFSHDALELLRDDDVAEVMERVTRFPSERFENHLWLPGEPTLTWDTMTWMIRHRHGHLLPRQTLRALNLRRHLSGWPGHRHQMGGIGLPAPRDPARRTGEILLAQFASDTLLDYLWGDAGALQFWIPPEDAANDRFTRVRMTCDMQ